MFERSNEEYEKACKYIPGGVNSPARSFPSVEQDPLFIEKGDGSKVVDVDGNEYIDFINSWGSMLFGHCHEDVKESVSDVLEKGTSFGAPTKVETELAKKVVKMVPSIDRVRMVNSGTEATMTAIRLARGYTGRDKIVKFSGHYHGHGDSFLIKAGSGQATFGLPDSPGVPEELAKLTVSVPYNDEERVEEVFREEGDEIAAVILEPVAANMGVVPPLDGFLSFLRNITKEYGSLLMFDEVITGFRLGPGGAQEYYGVGPDLTCLGKIIGGGLPVGAFGGKDEVMDEIAPCGDVYQAGTLSGNPLAMAAGLEMMKLIQNDDIYEELEEKSDYFAEGLKDIIAETDIPITLNRVGSMLSTFFTDEDVIDYESADSSDTDLYGEYFQCMLKNGVYLSPSQFEAMFLSTAHSRDDLEKTINAAREVLLELDN